MSDDITLTATDPKAFHLVAAPESEFAAINKLIFALESKFPGTHRIRKQLFRARLEVSKAIEINRVKKDWPQEGWVYE